MFLCERDGHLVWAWPHVSAHRLRPAPGHPPRPQAERLHFLQVHCHYQSYLKIKIHQSGVKQHINANQASRSLEEQQEYVRWAKIMILFDFSECRILGWWNVDPGRPAYLYSCPVWHPPQPPQWSAECTRCVVSGNCSVQARRSTRRSATSLWWATPATTDTCWLATEQGAYMQWRGIQFLKLSDSNTRL